MHLHKGAEFGSALPKPLPTGESSSLEKQPIDIEARRADRQRQRGRIRLLRNFLLGGLALASLGMLAKAADAYNQYGQSNPGTVQPDNRNPEPPVQGLIVALPETTITPTGTATATATKPATSTSTSTATATKPALTPTPEPFKPKEEKTFPNGVVEKYGMVTEQNSDTCFIRVTPEEFAQINKEQANLPLFPYSPSQEFNMGEMKGADGVTNQINIYSKGVTVRASIDGQFNLSTMSVSSEKGSDGSYSHAEVFANNPQIDPHTRDKQKVKKGDILFIFAGSDEIAFNPEMYKADANRLAFYYQKRVDLDPPRVEMLPGGGKKTTKIDISGQTPLLSQVDKWIHKNGKIVILY